MTANSKLYRLIFFGSSDFSVPILEGLRLSKWQITAVVTQPDRPKGRSLRLSPTPVKAYAGTRGLPVKTWATLKSPSTHAELKALRPDFGVVAAYGQMIPEPVLKIFRKGVLNIHPSLLPKYRGPTPIQFALLNGEKTTGVSIIRLDAQMDHGPILAQKTVAIEAEDDYLSLQDRLSREAIELLNHYTLAWLAGNRYPVAQDDRKATYTKLLSREDGRVDWKKTADEICRQIKAFTPWPGCWSLLSGIRVKFLSARPADYAASLPPGRVLFKNGLFLVGCGNFTALSIEKLQPESGKPLAAATFVKTRSDLDAAVFG